MYLGGIAERAQRLLSAWQYDRIEKLLIPGRQSYPARTQTMSEIVI
jgi:hypothetical protein